MPIVENRKTFVVSATLAAAVQTFTANFSALTFVPDEMIVRSVAFREVGTSTTLTPIITCDFIPDPILSFSTATVANSLINVNYENTFMVKSSTLRGIHTFSVSNSTTTALNGNIAITLEFIQYRSKKY